MTVDALFEQAGVMRTDTLAELLDVASLLANQPLPKGPRVGIITNAGGPGIMCADACEASGLEVPPLPDDVQAKLRGFLAPEAGLGNPVDMIATATADQYREAIETIASWGGVDALVTIFVRPLLTKAEDVATAVRAAVAELSPEIPVLAVFMSQRDHAAMAQGGHIPTYLYPEDAARALARVMRHVRWRERPDSAPPTFDDARTDEAAAIIADALGRGLEWLPMPEAMRLLDCHRIAVAEWATAADPVAAGHVADRLGGRVALKAVGPGILHKSELGAVRTGLEGAAEVSWDPPAYTDVRLRRGRARAGDAAREVHWHARGVGGGRGSVGVGHRRRRAALRRGRAGAFYAPKIDVHIHRHAGPPLAGSDDPGRPAARQPL